MLLILNVCCIAELYKQVWLRLNTVLPRCLWVISINALLYESTAVKNVFLTQENIVLDPLQVLRCDHQVFRLVCPFIIAGYKCNETLFGACSTLSQCNESGQPCQWRDWSSDPRWPTIFSFSLSLSWLIWDPNQYEYDNWTQMFWYEWWHSLSELVIVGKISVIVTDSRNPIVESSTTRPEFTDVV
jgi:hypothetical protein